MSRGLAGSFFVFAGVALAVAAAELVFRLFASPGFVPVPRIAADSFGAPAVAHRQIEEGVATAHFTESGARLTGNPPLRSEPAAVILGDSYVVAEQVADDETMGAALERAARAGGVPLDVRQYGWSGASPAQYLYVADEVRTRWNPRRVFIELADNDLDRNALLLANPRLRIDSTGAVHVIGAPIPTSPSPARRSVLVMLLRHRWSIVSPRLPRLPQLERSAVAPVASQAAAPSRELPPDSAELARAPEGVVRALSGAYGERLTLVYIATVPVVGDSSAGPIERRFLDACARHRVDCVSTRDAMIASRSAGHVSHGTGISPLGNGHLNAHGHAVVGGLMWDRLKIDRTNAAQGLH